MQKILQAHSKQLSKHLVVFEEFKSSFEAICDDDDEKLNDILDETENQYNDLLILTSQCERASLLSIYYQVCTLDRNEGLTKREYNQFLAILNTEP